MFANLLWLCYISAGGIRKNNHRVKMAGKYVIKAMAIAVKMDNKIYSIWRVKESDSCREKKKGFVPQTTPFSMFLFGHG